MCRGRFGHVFVFDRYRTLTQQGLGHAHAVEFTVFGSGTRAGTTWSITLG